MTPVPHLQDVPEVSLVEWTGCGVGSTGFLGRYRVRWWVPVPTPSPSRWVTFSPGSSPGFLSSISSAFSETQNTSRLPRHYTATTMSVGRWRKGLSPVTPVQCLARPPFEMRPGVERSVPPSGFRSPLPSREGRVSTVPCRWTVSGCPVTARRGAGSLLSRISSSEEMPREWVPTARVTGGRVSTEDPRRERTVAGG